MWPQIIIEGAVVSLTFLPSSFVAENPVLRFASLLLSVLKASSGCGLYRGEGGHAVGLGPGPSLEAGLELLEASELSSGGKVDLSCGC